MEEDFGSTDMGITRTVRDLRPCHFLCKIDSYSLFEKENYESGVFEAGDYKWRLTFYPDGDKKRNGNGYISLYLTIAETDELPRAWEVNVNFKLFVFDQIRDKYLTIQDDGEGAVRRFYDAKTKWGFPQLLSLDTFKNASNGYLIDDSCVFGAEVFVLKCTCKFDCLSMVTQPNANTFTWKIDKFSTLNKKFYYSEPFILAGRSWKLAVFPKGNDITDALSVYLEIMDIPPKPVVTATLEICVKDQLHGNHVQKTITSHPFSYKTMNWGYTHFISLKELHNASRGLVVKDTVIIEVKLTID